MEYIASPRRKMTKCTTQNSSAAPWRPVWPTSDGLRRHQRWHRPDHRDSARDRDWQEGRSARRYHAGENGRIVRTIFRKQKAGDQAKPIPTATRKPITKPSSPQQSCLHHALPSPGKITWDHAITQRKAGDNHNNVCQSDHLQTSASSRSRRDRDERVGRKWWRHNTATQPAARRQLNIRRQCHGDRRGRRQWQRRRIRT